MDSKYEIKYNNLIQGLEEMHAKNVKRTKAALRCLLIIPAVILIMLFMTKGSKTIFLVLWIAAAIAAPAANDAAPATQRAGAIRQAVQQRSPEQDSGGFRYDNYDESAGDN